ncbi:unnamed protein product [Orchesella dallaii]|uniref:Uncharacterized protein n=1 Tax=Orchesella dallaii TaxID=48710 RepID=A0ABP1SAA4_9HEXA
MTIDDADEEDNEGDDDEEETRSRSSKSLRTSRPLIARVAVADASTSSRSMPVVKANPAKGRMDRPWREKRTLKGKNAQNINPAKSFGKQKRFRTRKPTGAVALAATKKVALDCDDPKDITFESPVLPNFDFDMTKFGTEEGKSKNHVACYPLEYSFNNLIHFILTPYSFIYAETRLGSANFGAAKLWHWQLWLLRFSNEIKIGFLNPYE